MPRPRTSIHELARILDESPFPIYALDEQRKIVFCNRACTEWLGLPPEELIGRRCSYHWPAEGDAVELAVAGLCPSPEILSGHEHRGEVFLAPPDKAPLRRRGTFLPIGEPTEGALIAILDPLDEPASGVADTAPSAELQSKSHSALHKAIADFRQLLSARYGAYRLLGDAPQIKLARQQVALAAASDINVLVCGAPGTGKRHLAKAIHYQRHASDHGLVPLACSALPAEMLRSTLRALRTRRAGADSPGETLLLRDVDATDAEIQAELAETLASDPSMRILSTATVPLMTLADEGKFRRDLACLLGTLVIVLPPLAERTGDLPLLAQASLEGINSAGKKQIGGVSSDAMDLLVAFAWPGNLDELDAVLREAHSRAAGFEIAASDLPERIRAAAGAAAYPHVAEETIELEAFLARVERELIERALRRARGNKSRAARLLGLTRPRLYRRLVQLGLEPPSWPGPAPDQLEPGGKGGAI